MSACIQFLNMLIQFCVLFLASVSRVNSAESHKLPENFSLCKRNAEVATCLLQAIPVALKALKPNGIPELGVPSLDPLHATLLEIGQGHGPVSINLKFSDIEVAGFSDVNIQEIKEVDLNAVILQFNGFAETLVLSADYEMTGKILLLPISGKGRAKIVFKNANATAGPSGKIIQKKGKDYFNVTEFKMDVLSIEKLQVHFENLFNGDKTLGESMNALLNENWKDLWAEVKEPMIETLTAIFHQYSKRLFDKVPFNDIFLDP